VFGHELEGRRGRTRGAAGACVKVQLFDRAGVAPEALAVCALRRRTRELEFIDGFRAPDEIDAHDDDGSSTDADVNDLD
jgi:hypothetical protein